VAQEVAPPNLQAQMNQSLYDIDKICAGLVNNPAMYAQAPAPAPPAPPAPAPPPPPAGDPIDVDDGAGVGRDPEQHSEHSNLYQGDVGDNMFDEMLAPPRAPPAPAPVTSAAAAVPVTRGGRKSFFQTPAVNDD
jgi:hypothetical protein